MLRGGEGVYCARPTAKESQTGKIDALIVLFKKAFGARLRGDKGVCEFRVWRVADHDEQGDAMLDDGSQLVWFVADASVVCPAAKG